MSHPLVADLEQWIVLHMTKHYPALTRDDRTHLYTGSPRLQSGYRALRLATDAGDEAAIKQAARQVYLCWVEAFAQRAPAAPRMAQEPHSPQGSPQTPDVSLMPPAPDESPFRRYHSADLDAEILLCRNAAEAAPYWEHPEAIVAYVPAELSLLRHLKAHDPDHFQAHLAWLHQQKQLFGGQLTVGTTEAALKHQPGHPAHAALEGE